VTSAVSALRDAVIVLTPWFPRVPGEREGNYIYDSAKAIAGQGWPVYVLVPRPLRPGFLAGHTSPGSQLAPQADAFDEFAGVQSVTHLSVPRSLTPRLNDAILDRTVMPALRRTLDRASARLIHVHTESLAPAAVQVARETGSKVIVTLHGVNVGPRHFNHPARRSRFREALAAADRVILVGEPLRPFFRDLVGRDDHFRVVPNGFSLQPVERRSTMLESGRVLRLVSVSNLHEGKGIELNLEALGSLSRRGMTNWAYDVVGDGDQRDRLRRMVAALGLGERVSFVGALPHQEVARRLSVADVFILPSYREAFGIAYLEAMAAGLLVVGVQGQGPSAFIEHGVNGLLVPPRDSKALAHELEAVMREPSRFRGMAANAARVAVERFDWRNHAISVQAVYREALDTQC
jgi:glycosyltransferase involved in cell wall biosynthesis